ncbi:LysR family transcriptional regulator substrate-binding protein, partial [Escherichia coli]|nr:LysR family transcriptional regulator substrate-binding protein [Escherichia coli]
GSVELGILAFPEAKRGLTIREMPSDRLVLVCQPDHKFANRTQLKTKELAGAEFVHFERDTPTRKATDRMLRSAGIEVK